MEIIGLGIIVFALSFYGAITSVVGMWIRYKQQELQLEARINGLVIAFREREE